MEIDLTGNWRDTAQFEPFVRIREPALAGQQPRRVAGHEMAADPSSGMPECLPGQETEKTFFQDLRLPADGCRLRIDYLPHRDVKRGFAIDGRFDVFEGLRINGAVQRLAWQETTDASQPVSAPESGSVAANVLTGGSGRIEHWHWLPQEIETHSISCEFTGCKKGDTVRLAFTWKFTRPPVARLQCGAADTAGSRFHALPPGGAGWLLMAHGVPFLAAGIEYSYAEFHLPECPAGGMGPWNGTAAIPAADAEVDTIHFLGMIHLFDRGNGSWYTPRGDHGYSHFVGDRAGEILLNWTDGTTSRIPLVFGFNLWVSRPWDLLWHFSLWNGVRWNYDHMLFDGRDECRDRIRDGLALVDGIRPGGGASSNCRYVFSVDLAGRKLASVAFQDTPELHFHPLISAVTLETRQPVRELPALPALSPLAANMKPVALDAIERREFEPAVRKIMRDFYGFIEDNDTAASPEIPEGYTGPRYDFRGVTDAVCAASFLYRNGPECGAYIADRGMGFSSPTARGWLPSYQYSFGPWCKNPRHYESLQQWFRLYRERQPGQLPGIGFAWSRGAGELIREAMALGYDKFIESQLDWLDNTLFKEANPPHWHRSPGLLATITREHKVGDVTERGMRENDGHGCCMWARYLVWHGQGRPRAWNEKHFAATAAAVEWIQWQLDTDTLRPGVRKDVLYTESECADESYDIYSSYSCLHGIKLSIRMATQLGRTDLAERWGALHQRLRKGILEHLLVTSGFGPVWYTWPECDWQDHAHRLVHLQLAADGDSYTPLQDYAAGDETDRRYLQISRNTYACMMKERNYNSLRMYGYGQGMMAQSALLLDEMHDAACFMSLLLRHAHLPHLAGWACPEGIIVHRSGKYYLPVNGYEGQDSHVADSVKAMRIMIGVDDNDPAHLRLVPRFPADWPHAGIRDYPALAGGRRQKLGYTYRRSPDSQSFEFSFEQDPGRFSIRFGPLPAGRQAARASVRGREVPFTALDSGDSRWAWVDVDGGCQGCVELRLR